MPYALFKTILHHIYRYGYCRDGTRTRDLWVMSPACYQLHPPCIIICRARVSNSEDVAISGVLPPPVRLPIPPTQHNENGPDGFEPPMYLTSRIYSPLASPICIETRINFSCSERGSNPHAVNGTGF